MEITEKLLNELQRRFKFGSRRGVSAVAYTNYTVVQSAASQIKSSVVSGSMPRNGTLTAAEKSIITCWVDNGAKNN
ncbi:MAG: hypothetical protein ACKO33_00865 [Bacteroidota bacterium]